MIMLFLCVFLMSLIMLNGGIETFFDDCDYEERPIWVKVIGTMLEVAMYITIIALALSFVMFVMGF